MLYTPSPQIPKLRILPSNSIESKYLRIYRKWFNCPPGSRVRPVVVKIPDIIILYYTVTKAIRASFSQAENDIYDETSWFQCPWYVTITPFFYLMKLAAGHNCSQLQQLGFNCCV